MRENKRKGKPEELSGEEGGQRVTSLSNTHVVK